MEEYVSAMFLPHTDCGRFPRRLRRARFSLRRVAAWPTCRARRQGRHREDDRRRAGRPVAPPGGPDPILAVDADPNACLDAALGLRPGADDLGRPRRQPRPARGARRRCPSRPTWSTSSRTAWPRGAGMDLIAMGRPEGPACYCAANHLLRTLHGPADGRLPVGRGGQRGGHGAPQPPDHPRRGPAPHRQRRRRWSGSGRRSGSGRWSRELNLPVRRIGAGGQPGRRSCRRRWRRRSRPTGSSWPGSCPTTRWSRQFELAGPPPARAARRCARRSWRWSGCWRPLELPGRPRVSTVRGWRYQPALRARLAGHDLAGLVERSGARAARTDDRIGLRCLGRDTSSTIPTGSCSRPTAAGARDRRRSCSCSTSSSRPAGTSRGMGAFEQLRAVRATSGSFRGRVVGPLAARLRVATRRRSLPAAAKPSTASRSSSATRRSGCRPCPACPLAYVVWGGDEEFAASATSCSTPRSRGTSTPRPSPSWPSSPRAGWPGPPAPSTEQGGVTMTVELMRETWPGRILTVTIGATAAEGGTRSSTVTVGGHGALPFRPATRRAPTARSSPSRCSTRCRTDWPEHLRAPLADVVRLARRLGPQGGRGVRRRPHLPAPLRRRIPKGADHARTRPPGPSGPCSTRSPCR